MDTGIEKIRRLEQEVLDLTARNVRLCARLEKFEILKQELIASQHINMRRQEDIPLLQEKIQDLTAQLEGWIVRYDAQNRKIKSYEESLSQKASRKIINLRPSKKSIGAVANEN